MKYLLGLSLAIVLIFGMEAPRASAVTGSGPIECVCYIRITPDGGAVVTATTSIRGDSISSIDGGLCQEYKVRSVEALEASGTRVSDAISEVPAGECFDTRDTDASTLGETDGPPARTDYSPASFGYVNPLGTASVPELISRLIRAVLGIVGALFLAMFVYGGVLWTTAGGDAKKVQNAKTTLINAVIGIMIIAFSYAIVSTILGFAGSITASS